MVAARVPLTGERVGRARFAHQELLHRCALEVDPPPHAGRADVVPVAAMDSAMDGDFYSVWQYLRHYDIYAIHC